VNVSRLCDAATAEALALGWLEEQLATASEYGRERLRGLEPFDPGAESDAQQQASRFVSIANAAGPEVLESIREALRELPDVRGQIARARLGEVLTDTDFFMLLRFCEITARLSSLVGNAFLDEGITVCSEARDALAAGKSGAFGFYLADEFDPTLAARRRELQEAEAQLERLRRQLAERVAGELQRAQIATDQFIVMRDEVHGTLPSGVRVVREAPTYFLCELELDSPALETLQQRDRCAAAAATAEEAVRVRLTSAIAGCADALELSAEGAGRIDVTVAAARFAQHYRCVAATYLREPSFQISDGRFLPLEHDLALKDRSYVPIALTLERANVLTGPNMGGKSAALCTAGFIAACAAFGLPVPAGKASVGLFSRICWLGIGAEDSAQELLSSFAREIVRLRHMLEEEAATLWLIDEFARTTAPDEARALLLALLRRLGEGKNCALAATHLGDLDGDAKIAHFAVRGLRGDGAPVAAADTGDALRALAERMDYRIQRVSQAQKSESDAIELAGYLGLDKELVESAKEILARCSR